MITNVLTNWMTVEIQKHPGCNIDILHIIIKHKYTTIDICFYIQLI